MRTNDILRILIKQSGLNQTQFGEKHGYKHYRICGWVNDIRNISMHNLELIAFNEGYKLNVELKLEKL